MHAPSRSADDRDRLITGYFDETLSPDDETLLERLVTDDPDAALEVARAALFHDRLRDVLRMDAAEAPSTGRAAATRRGKSTGGSWDRRWLSLAVAVSVVIAAFVALRQTGGTALAAGVALDRLVAAATIAADREYVVRVLDHGPDGPSPTVMSGGQGRKPGIDGARLFLRGGDRFVLVRRFGDGSEFLTGSDGAVGWAVPPKGPVHLSRDVRRFRRGMPGEREAVPFVDLRAGFEELRRGYRLALLADGDAQVLRAERQRRHDRGPAVVRVWFAGDGVATRIEMDGLATEDGQPRGVALELVSRSDRETDFFGHAAHHAADRDVEWE